MTQDEIQALREALRRALIERDAAQVALSSEKDERIKEQEQFSYLVKQKDEENATLRAENEKLKEKNERAGVLIGELKRGLS